MEEEEHSSEVTNSTVVVENTVSSKDLNEDLVNLDQTIQIENSSLKTCSAESVEVTNPVPENIDNKRKKAKEEKPLSKIVVRRLPPTMSKEQFLEQVSPIPEVDYIYFIQGDVNNNINPFSRAYLNFVNQEDLFSFSRTFDNYVFLDAKGQEYPAVVEFAMFQRVPKQRPKKKDPLMGTIETDPTFITFKENLLAEALEHSKTGGKAVKQHYFETDISTAEEVNTTPLLEFLKVRRAEKARMREERREEKKRKELERKQKQKVKDKKGEGDEEESSKESKIQQKPSENHEKEINEKNKVANESEISGKYDELIEKPKNDDLMKESLDSTNISQDQKVSILGKSDKDKLSNENEPQNKGNSSSNGGAVESNADVKTCGDTNSVPDAEVLKIKEAEQQTMYLRKLLGLVPSEGRLPSGKKEVLLREKKESKERESRSVKKRDEKERVKETTRVREFKSRGGKSYQEERLRLAERREEQKKRELLSAEERRLDDAQPNDGSADPGEVTSEQTKTSDEKTSKFEKKKFEYRKKFDDDWKEEKRRNRNERNSIRRDGRERKDDYRRNQDKKLSESDLKRKIKSYKNSEYSKTSDDRKKSTNVLEVAVEKVEKKEQNNKSKFEVNGGMVTKEKWKSVDDLVLISTVERKKSDSISVPCDEPAIIIKKRHSSMENLRIEEKIPAEAPKKVTLLQREKSETNKENTSNFRSRKDISSQKTSIDSKTYSNKKKEKYNDRHEEIKDSSEQFLKSRNQESDGSRNKDAPRSERRIRNKDRPSIEIYRPGMGKFSKQRLEKEKALGSSTEVDSPSHSPSPTPKTKIVT